MSTTDERDAVAASDLLLTPWKCVIAMVSPVVAIVLGAAMSVQWAIGGDDLGTWPAGPAAIARWMAEHLPLMDSDGEPIWAWRGPFFLSLALILPLVWEVTARVASSVARWCTRGGLLVATFAIGLEYSTPGYGWLFDLAALLVAIAGTVACGVSGLRRRRLPSAISWSLMAVLPLTPVAGFLVFWYMPPGLTLGLLLSWTLAAAFAFRAKVA